LGQIVLGVGDFAASSDAADVLKTFSLGSCVAVTFWDPRRRIAGMAHIVLPDSSQAKDKADERPGFFADTGIEAVLRRMADLGCHPRGRGVVIKAAGGARMLELAKSFDIGKHNVLAVRKVLWSLGLGLLAEDTGGSESRTVEIDVAAGTTRITAPDRRERIL